MATAPKKPAVKAAAKPSVKSSAKKDAPAKPATITLKQIVAEIADSHDITKRQSEAILTEMIESIVNSLKNGDRVRIAGLGILQVRERAARMGRNPATKEPIEIKASKKVAFRPLKELKEAI